MFLFLKGFHFHFIIKFYHAIRESLRNETCVDLLHTANVIQHMVTRMHKLKHEMYRKLVKIDTFFRTKYTTMRYFLLGFDIHQRS